MGRPYDLTGRQFGSVCVERRVSNGRDGKSRWLVVCSCGAVKEMSGVDLVRGRGDRGCGSVTHPRVHGEASHLRRSPEYTVWLSIKARCYNPKIEHYPIYGGRGVRVADAWREDFSAFLAAVGRRPSAEHQLVLVDRAGHYEAGNVRWARREDGVANRRTAHLVTFRGETQLLSTLCTERGLLFDTVVSRLKTGWTIEEALETPARKITTKRVYEDVPGVIFDDDSPAAMDLGARLMKAGSRKPGRKTAAVPTRRHG